MQETVKDGVKFVGLESVCLARHGFEASHIAALLRASDITVYIANEDDLVQDTLRNGHIPIWVQKPSLNRASEVILEARLAGIQFIELAESPEATED